jgi:hypothetical protein
MRLVSNAHIPLRLLLSILYYIHHLSAYTLHAALITLPLMCAVPLYDSNREHIRWQ